MWFRKRKVDPPESLEERLVDAKARLARYEQLPESDFTLYPNLQNGFPIVQHGVDRKPLLIARAKADVAELEVRIAAKRQYNLAAAQHQEKQLEES